MRYSTSIHTFKNQRKDNEDSALALSVEGPGGALALCLCLSDGMGGLHRGAEASALAVSAAGAKLVELLPSSNNEAACLLAAESATLAANNAVLALSQRTGESCGATLALAFCLPDGTCAAANAGDSDIFLFFKDGMTLLSHSHSYANLLVDQGKITRTEALSHDGKGTLLEHLGKSDLSFHSRLAKLNPGDRLALMSDGARSLFSGSELFKMLGGKKIEKWADVLFKAGRGLGEEDNQTLAAALVLR
ncbi:MAG: protein phosphatase 2C domain-containing protein [Clostridiales bacterium]|jgi:protein phosphatase|nr:protein phosphatase 2C domain-containing protein [Clostridiales bacterium]